MVSIVNLIEYDFNADKSIGNKRIDVNSVEGYVEENTLGFYDYGTISYYIDNSLYYDINAFKNVIRNPGSNSHALCTLAERVYNENGFYSNEINKMVANTNIVYIISPLKNDKPTYKLKEEFIDFNNNVEINSVALDMLIETKKYGVYFGYLEYGRNRDKEQRILRLPPKYIKILANDGISPIIGIDLYSVSTNDRKNLFPASLRTKIDAAIKKLAARKKTSVESDEVYNSENIEFLKNQYLKIDKRRTIVVINGDTRSASWGQIELLKALDQIATDLKIEDKIKDGVGRGDRNILAEVLPGNDQKSAGVRIKNVSLSKKAASEQHANVKAAAQSTDAASALTLASGSTIQVLNIKDMFANYNSEDSLKRLLFYAGVPASLATGEAEGQAIANYMKSGLNVTHINLVKFSVEVSKIFHAFKRKDKKIVTMSYIKSNDYVRKDNLESSSKLFTEAGGSYEEYIAAIGRDPHTYIAQMQQERDLKYDEKFEPHLTAHNISKDDQGVTSRDDDSGEK